MTGFRLFTLAGVPVSVTLYYLILLGYYAFVLNSMTEAIVWIATLTLSLLVHEFGHALVARHYKLRPQVFLHGFGGLCSHDRASRDLHDVFIISAGPGVGIAFAILVLAIEKGLLIAAPGLLQSKPVLQLVFDYIWWISFIWNFVNLVPLWPLDGGQLFRLAALKVLGPKKGERATHGLGVFIGVIGALIGYQLGGTLALILCALLIWENAQRLMSGRTSGPIRTTNRFAAELHAKAQEAMESGDWREAARLGHQIRAETNVPDRLLDKVWQLLAVSTTQLGEYEEALGYVKRAPKTPMVAEAEVRCLAMLGRKADAEAALGQPPASKLPERTRQTLQTLIDEH